MLQQDRHITQIRKWLTKKILDWLEELNDKEPEKYLEFWEQFGRALKEGVASEFDHKIEWCDCFSSTHHTTLRNSPPSRGTSSG